MNYQIYRAIRIFIASPSDLQEERKIFVDIVTEVNQLIAHSMGYHLEAIGWETTMPGMGRAQELINNDLLGCNLFIMLLWNKWGSPTGKYTSGTEEEFYVAIEAYRKKGEPEIWLFFKEADPNNRQEAVSTFRKMIENEQIVKYNCFNDTSEWRDILRMCLCKWTQSLKPISNGVQEANNKDGIFYSITYQDDISLGPKNHPEIYFTVSDLASFEAWKSLSSDEKKRFAYNLLSENLGIILGANPYSAIVRYLMPNGKLILLCTVQKKYEQSYEQSWIHIPPNYTTICTASQHEIVFNGRLYF